MSAIINADELVDVVDETNTILLGTATRKQVHSTGQYHRAVNVLLFNSDNQILLQKRMPTKELCPNAWDLSCSEHLRHLESYENGALRGLREELNIIQVEHFERVRSSTLQFFDDDARGIHDHGFTECFKVIYNGPIEADGIEVAETKFVALDTLKTMMKENPEQFTPWSFWEFEKLFANYTN